MPDAINNDKAGCILLTLITYSATGWLLLGCHTGGIFAGNYTDLIAYAKDGEEVEDAARRIANEWRGIKVGELELRGIFTFTYSETGDDKEYEFFCKQFSGEVRETENIRSEWFSIRENPFDKVAAAAEILYPLYLEGKTLRGQFSLSPDMQGLLSHALKEVDNH